MVHKGEHVVSLTVRNETSRPVNQLTITSEKALPTWLRVPQTFVPLLTTEDAHEVTFPLTVVDAPENAHIILPLILTDDLGRTWQVRVGLRFGASPPLQDALLPNVPNPFNPTTTIRYHLSGTAARPTTLMIYTISGQQVRTLVNETQKPGVYKIHWDGTDDQRRVVASGIYLYKLVSGNFSQTQKMMLIK